MIITNATDSDKFIIVWFYVLCERTGDQQLLRDFRFGCSRLVATTIAVDDPNVYNNYTHSHRNRALLVCSFAGLPPADNCQRLNYCPFRLTQRGLASNCQGEKKRRIKKNDGTFRIVYAISDVVCASIP